MEQMVAVLALMRVSWGQITARKMVLVRAGERDWAAMVKRELKMGPGAWSCRLYGWEGSRKVPGRG